MLDLKVLAAIVATTIKGHVAVAIAAVSGRLDGLEARLIAMPAGPKGEKGDNGESVRGEKGEPGAPGRDGEGVDLQVIRDMVLEEISGLPRPADGKDGAPGRDGSDGESVDVDAVAPMLRDMVDKAVAAIPPAQNGKDGAPGRDGVDGKNGEPVHPDTVALMIRAAVDNAVAAIPRAKDGAPGRDAAELVLLPSIDETRRYAAGTWAAYQGGLIRASRATDPITAGLSAAGWTVMVEGVAAIETTQGDDPRAIEVSTVLTSGTKKVTAFRVPMVIDRGVWREGEHQAGDHVSWDGSGWIAQVKTSAKPGTSTDWRLSTKRGRDGKDGKSFAAAAIVRDPVRIE